MAWESQMPASKANRVELPSLLKARKLLTGAGKGGGSGQGWGGCMATSPWPSTPIADL